jgi:hypothetical protein
LAQYRAGIGAQQSLPLVFGQARQQMHGAARRPAAPSARDGCLVNSAFANAKSAQLPGQENLVHRHLQTRGQVVCLARQRHDGQQLGMLRIRHALGARRCSVRVHAVAA